MEFVRLGRVPADFANTIPTAPTPLEGDPRHPRIPRLSDSSRIVSERDEEDPTIAFDSLLALALFIGAWAAAYLLYVIVRML